MKGDYLAMFNYLHIGELDIKRLNYGVITLVPKIKAANNYQTISTYMPLKYGF
jgi:hypothetical protein